MTIPLPLLSLAVVALLMAGATLGALALALCVAARDDSPIAQEVDR